MKSVRHKGKQYMTEVKMPDEIRNKKSEIRNQKF